MAVPPFFYYSARFDAFDDAYNAYLSQTQYSRSDYRMHWDTSNLYGFGRGGRAGNDDPIRRRFARTTARQAHRRIRGVAEYTIINMAGDIVTEMAQGVVGGEAEFWETLKEAVNSKATLSALHNRAAQHGQAVMIDTYLRNVENVKGKANTQGADALRNAKSRRYAGGILLRALENGNFFASGPYGITFGNLEALNVAPQWKRLNYGAGPRGRKGDENLARFINEAQDGSGYVAPYSPTRGRGAQYQSFLTKALGSMAKELQRSPEPRFKVPRGIWIGKDGGVVAPGQGRRGTDAFVPATPDAVKYAKERTKSRGGATFSGRRRSFSVEGNSPLYRKPTKDSKGLMFQPEMFSQGIASRKFIDAGLVAMVSALGKEYDALWDYWLTTAGYRRHPKSDKFTENARGPATRSAPFGAKGRTDPSTFYTVRQSKETRFNRR